MSQQGAIGQTAATTTTTTGSEMTPVLGTLQSVGPNNQSSPVLPNVQTGTVQATTVQPQTQSQQTQYVPQPSKPVQQSTPSSFSDFPQVRYPTQSSRHHSSYFIYIYICSLTSPMYYLILVFNKNKITRPGKRSRSHRTVGRGSRRDASTISGWLCRNDSKRSLPIS